MAPGFVVKNGSNMRPCVSGLMPFPVSVTATTAWPSSTRVATLTTPFSGTASTALTIR